MFILLLIKMLACQNVVWSGSFIVPGLYGPELCYRPAPDYLTVGSANTHAHVAEYATQDDQTHEHDLQDLQPPDNVAPRLFG